MSKLTPKQVVYDIILSSIFDGLLALLENGFTSSNIIRGFGLPFIAYSFIESSRYIQGDTGAIIGAALGGGWHYYIYERKLIYAPLGSTNYLAYEVLSQYNQHYDREEEPNEYYIIESLDSFMFSLIDDESIVTNMKTGMILGWAGWVAQFYISTPFIDSLDISENDNREFTNADKFGLYGTVKQDILHLPSSVTSIEL